jgi:alanine racemase
MTISIYDIGYADGFLRIKQKVPFHTTDGSQILGRVSMDNIVINSDKDELSIFDDVNKLKKIRGTISYEILTSLSKTLQREIV